MRYNKVYFNINLFAELYTECRLNKSTEWGRDILKCIWIYLLPMLNTSDSLLYSKTLYWNKPYCTYPTLLTRVTNACFPLTLEGALAYQNLKARGYDFDLLNVNIESLRHEVESQAISLKCEIFK